MVKDYEIQGIHTIANKEETSIVRNLTLKVGSNKSLTKMSRCLDRSTDKKTLDISGPILNECYIPLTLDKIRELDRDKEALDYYILSRAKYLDSGNINVLSIRLVLKPQEKIEKKDYEFINSLLTWSRNDIYLVPTLEFDGVIESSEKCNIYDTFVKQLLEDKKTWTNANSGIMIPSYYPRALVDNLFEMYKDEGSRFVAVDFDNKRMDKPSQTIGTIVRHFNSKDEGAFMYAVNLKPYKKGHTDESAWDIYAMHGTFNAIGPTHPKPRKVVLPNDWRSAGRVFDANNVSYPVLDENHRDCFFDWTEKNYHFRFEDDYSKNTSGVYNYLKRYNFNQINLLLSEFSKAIDKGETEFIDEMVAHIPPDMANTKITAVENTSRRKRKRINDNLDVI
ncbi:MAG: hypothetical protein IKN41_01070 [Candidatus Methanomethylophilaceae archaeon]|nr:hypothetical protein [Candidatus Methanomethylophilaceae archaeon]